MKFLHLEPGRVGGSYCAKRRRPQCEPGPPNGGGGAGYPPQPRSELLDGFAVQREVEAFAFDLFADPQTDEEVHDLEQDQRNDGVIDEYGDDADALVDELLDVAIEAPAVPPYCSTANTPVSNAPT